MSTPAKPSIVFAHGVWADGSCFNKLIPALRADGHEVMAAQYGLDSVKGDVEATIRTFHYDDLESLKAHVLSFVTAYNFAKHLKALKWKTPR